MKTAIARLSMILLLGVAAHQSRSEIVTLFSSGSSPQASSTSYTNTYANSGNITNGWYVVVGTNEVCKLFGVTFAPWIGSSIGVTAPTANGLGTGFLVNQSNLNTPAPPPLAFVGPGVVWVSGVQSMGGGVSTATFSITRNDDFVGPQNTVAIPADAAGPVTVKMETSTNLVDWILSNPGSYGVSSQMRYFRLRAVREIP